MLKNEDIEIRIGRCSEGSFLQMIHRPTGIERIQAPLGDLDQTSLKEKWLKEIEADLIAKDMRQHIV
jgi:hypothetical protein